MVLVLQIKVLMVRDAQVRTTMAVAEAVQEEMALLLELVGLVYLHQLLVLL